MYEKPSVCLADPLCLIDLPVVNEALLEKCKVRLKRIQKSVYLYNVLLMYYRSTIEELSMYCWFVINILLICIADVLSIYCRCIDISLMYYQLLMYR